MSQLPHNPCHTCGACCRSYAVPVCGYDLWRISTHQRLRPQEFVIAARQKEVTPEGFRLEREGPTYFLVLDKQGKIVPNNPCIFLMRLGGNHDRCGVYTHRPVVCQVYPMSIRNQIVLQRTDSLCPPNAWPEAMVQHPAWRAALQRQRMHFDIYYHIVARWNARVAATAGTAVTLTEYVNYLLNVYDRLADLDRQTGSTALAAAEATWPLTPPGEANGDSVTVHTGDFPWLDYLNLASDVIDSFYPHIKL